MVLRRVLRALPERQRQAVVLRVIRNMSVADTNAILDLPD
jgi:DNA-directed RNA polymerase specialized sigma24 family protein